MRHRSSLLFRILLFLVHTISLVPCVSSLYFSNVPLLFTASSLSFLHPTRSEVTNDLSSENAAATSPVLLEGEKDKGSTSLSLLCPSPCECSPSLPPSVLPGLWDIPPRRPAPTVPKDRAPLAASCEGLGLRTPPPAVKSDGNPITHTIVEMGLSNNLLKELPDEAFADYPDLKQLKLTSNHMVQVASGAFQGLSLRVLLLDQNELTELPYDLFLPPLEELSLEGNFFPSIPPPVTKILSLKALNLANNKLQELREDDLSHLPSLVTLTLSSNLIASVHPQSLAALPSLENLDLAENNLPSVPRAILLCPSITRLLLSNNKITSLDAGVFSGLRNLQVVTLHGNPLVSVHRTAFQGLPSLSSIQLQEVSNLIDFPRLVGSTALDSVRIDRSSVRTVPPSLCSQAPALRSLNLHHNLLEHLPDLERCLDLRLLDLSHNRLVELPGGALRTLGKLQDLLLQHNNIKVLSNTAFFGLHSLQILNLENNQISMIQPDAFLPLVQLRDINLGNNQLSEFPETGLEHVVTLKVHHNRHLRVFPGPERFKKAHTLVLSYAYHCCAFIGSEEDEEGDATDQKFTEDVIYNVEDIQGMDNTLLLNMSDVWAEMDFPPRVVADQVSPVDGASVGPSSTATPPQHRPPIHCIPRPGPFMPCRDLFDWWTLRCGVWIVFLLALLGNGTVVVVLCFSRSKMDVPRFLVANLALADFFMGVYLGFLAVIDASTLGEFRMYAIPWQMSSGCQVAGFIGVLSSELSVYTLTVITLERNYAITHAMHLNKRLSLRHATIVMFGGWVFAGSMAMLPLAGVSDYRKFAICLPFETDGAGLIYVVSLMFVNGSAFLILMICYMKIYCSIRGSQAWNSNDSRIAKRMALLVFTDFICLAPIAFFSLTAAFGYHLITLEEAKVFTVFVLPFNSCCNPFLYALLTKQFKKDCVILCKTIEESRVTRGIGRCRHSSNFSNRQTPANTNSAVEQSSKSNGDDCNCQAKKQIPPTLRQRIRISMLKFMYCHRSRTNRNVTNEFTYEQSKLGNKPAKNTSLSSETYSSSYSDNWKRGKMPLSLRLLDRRRQSSWYLARKPSQESNLSSSRNDSSATTASTSTWRISRSSVSSDISSGASRVLGKNDSQLSLKLGSFRDRKGEGRPGSSPTVMVMQHTPSRGNSFKKMKPKLQRQTAVERETYLSSKLAADGTQCPKPNLRDNLSCVYEQDSFEEDDMTQVTAFLSPTYRLAGLAVGFIPRKLSTISSHSMSGNKDNDTEPSQEDSASPDQLYTPCDIIGNIVHLENGSSTLPPSNSVRSSSPMPGDLPHRKRKMRYSRCPSENDLRRKAAPEVGIEHMRRVATMPVIPAPSERLSRNLRYAMGDEPDDDDDVFVNSAVPVGLLETHFPLDEPPDEGDPLL